jgi:hypothetical protein
MTYKSLIERRYARAFRLRKCDQFSARPLGMAAEGLRGELADGDAPERHSWGAFFSLCSIAAGCRTSCMSFDFAHQRIGKVDCGTH